MSFPTGLGIQLRYHLWIPAFAGMTIGKEGMT